MKELIILYKHQRKMQIKESGQNDEMPNEDDLEVVDELYEVSDDDESNEKPEELVKEMPGNNNKDPEKSNTKTMKRRLRRQKLEESIKDAKETTTRLWDFGDLPDSKSCLNCNSEKHKIDSMFFYVTHVEDWIFSVFFSRFFWKNSVFSGFSHTFSVFSQFFFQIFSEKSLFTPGKLLFSRKNLD
jgi:hypothetical protein